MRPDLKNVIENDGVNGAIQFLESVGNDGIQLSKSETTALAKLIWDLSKIQENKL